MSKVFMTTRKTVTAVIAVILTAMIIFGGTFAWQSISQQALNEVSATANPGGRLHDDFVDITYGDDEIADFDTMTLDKDVYVENFTSLLDNGAQIFARIRLDEYMEFGTGAGELGDGNKATSLIPGAKLNDKSTWTTYIPGKASDFQKYWEWSFGGSTMYMPTFNKNKDSLEADINGTFKNNFSDYIDYGSSINSPKDGLAVYDKDANPDDELVRDGLTIPDAEAAGHIRTEEETHIAKETIIGTVLSMEDWLKPIADGGMGGEPGDYWVYDADGWAYWANPISPETATGLLLTEINRTEAPINEDWYYGINVVAQFISKDDIGVDDGTGFYDDKDGSLPPSENALKLLSKIGVDVTFEVDSVEKLQDVLAYGGDIVLTDNIAVDTNLVVAADTTLDLDGHTITADTDIFDAGDADIWSLLSVQGADTTLTIKGGDFIAKENDSFAVDVRDGASLVIEGGNFVGNVSAVYVHKGSLLINGGSFSIMQKSDVPGEVYESVINAYNQNFADGTAEIRICGGTFKGFNPTAANDGDLVSRGYAVSSAVGTDGVDVYTVSPVSSTAE